MRLIEGFFFWGKYNENEWSIINVWRGKGWKILVYILFIKNVNKKENMLFRSIFGRKF